MRHGFKPVYALILMAPLAVGCGDFPDLDSTISPEAESADYPALVPLEPILAATASPQITEESQAGVAGRVAALRARAARLGGAVVDRTTKARMRRGITAR